MAEERDSILQIRVKVDSYNVSVEEAWSVDEEPPDTLGVLFSHIALCAGCGEGTFTVGRMASSAANEFTCASFISCLKNFMHSELNMVVSRQELVGWSVIRIHVLMINLLNIVTCLCASHMFAWWVQKRCWSTYVHAQTRETRALTTAVLWSMAARNWNLLKFWHFSRFARPHPAGKLPLLAGSTTRADIGIQGIFSSPAKRNWTLYLSPLSLDPYIYLLYLLTTASLLYRIYKLQIFIYNYLNYNNMHCPVG